LRAGGAPVGDVVLREPAREVVVAHLVRRAAAAALLAHQAELDARPLQDERDRTRDGRAVERGLAVAEEDRLAARRQVEAVGPGAHVALGHLDVRAEDRLALPAVGQLVPALPAGLVDAALDRE